MRRWWREYTRGGLAGLVGEYRVPTHRPEYQEVHEPARVESPSLLHLLNSLPSTFRIDEWYTAVESALAGYLHDALTVKLEIHGIPSGKHADHESFENSIRIAIGDDGGIGSLEITFGSVTSREVVMNQLNELMPFLHFLCTDALARVGALAPRERELSEALASVGLTGILTPRECDVLAQRLRGLSYAEVARILGISEETVRKRVKSIYRKTKTASVGELFVKFFAHVR
jgi:DNA-binding CsgD family transcriptional regulator